MLDLARDLAISFNGEIYNFRELRVDLESRGYAFRTNSDTEVLLYLYAEYGAEMVHHIRGMFAFALWDGRKSGLLLARDHFGIKPLYIAQNSDGIKAASEVKALLELDDVDTAADPAGQVGFFLWGHVPEPFTLYRGIRGLPAGSTLWIDNSGQQQLVRYASLSRLLSADEEGEQKLSEGEIPAALRCALLDSVRDHLVSDVDVGVFLSAGLDSTCLTALASELRGQLKTITLGFEEYRGTANDETPLAEAVARHYGTTHTTIWVTRRDFQAELDRMIDRMDQPTIDGINSYFVARAAAESGLKVAISGLGGDELFGGYPSFRQIPKLVSVIGRIPAAAAMGRVVRSALAPMFGRVTSPKYAGLFEYGHEVAGAYLLRRGLFLPWELERFLDPDLLRDGLQELRVLEQLRETAEPIASRRLQVSALEASWYMRNQLLRDTDWASMSHSIEVRVPLVDWRLWQRVSKLIRSTESIDKAAMARTPRTPLPAALLTRPKTGFQIPTRVWMSEYTAPSGARGLRDWARYVYEAAA